MTINEGCFTEFKRNLSFSIKERSKAVVKHMMHLDILHENPISTTSFCTGSFQHGGYIMQTSVQESKDNLVPALCFIYLSDMSVWILILQATCLK